MPQTAAVCTMSTAPVASSGRNCSSPVRFSPVATDARDGVLADGGLAALLPLPDVWRGDRRWAKSDRPAHYDCTQLAKRDRAIAAALRPRTAPLGSAATAIRPYGVSKGAATTRPPAALTRSAALSASSTLK